MDNYVDYNKKEEYEVKNSVKSGKYTCTCSYCGKTFISVDPLQDICRKCMKEFSDDLCLIDSLAN